MGRCEHGKLHPPLMSCNSRMSCQSESRRSSFILFIHSSCRDDVSELEQAFLYPEELVLQLDCLSFDLGSYFSLIWLAAAQSSVYFLGIMQRYKSQQLQKYMILHAEEFASNSALHFPGARRGRNQ